MKTCPFELLKLGDTSSVQCKKICIVMDP